MYPTTAVYAFSSTEEAKDFANHMNQNYSGGTTRLIGEMDPFAAERYVRKEITKLLLDYDKYKRSPNCINHISDEEFISYIKKAVGLLNECYPL